ncbi:MAG: flagellar hook basal-body protein [Planctomycetaceae bacterium]|nr:MAG: flagellar hook basal-body protein [Planctomycetaceae bacterium]
MTDIGTQVSTSLDTLTREFDIVAHNLANASTAGYKRRCNAFTRALDEQTGTEGDGSAQEESAMPLDFSQGSLVQTDRTLDFALYGQGFFVIETPEGPLYTRHGVFQTNPNGQIVDLSGRVVAGIAGPISLPADVDPSAINVAGDGRISARGAAIGQFRVVEFPGYEDQLVPAGNTCFRVPPEVQPVEVLSPVVKQGYQEASNVRIVDELVNMITVSRLYEANMRLASVMKDTSSSMVNVAMG